MDKAYYLQRRNRYCPDALKLIFVLESPPISGKYFYDEDGMVSEPLFREMMRLLKYHPHTKRDGLEWFQNKGYFLVDSTYTPVNDLTGKGRDRVILDDFESLVADLHRIAGPVSVPIILVKANVCRLLEQPLRARGFDVRNHGIVVPFPSTGQQKRFHAEIAKILR